MNGAVGGWVSIGARLPGAVYMMVRWFGDVIRESEAASTAAGRNVVPLGMSWLSSRSDVLRLLLRHAVLDTQLPVPELANSSTRRCSGRASAATGLPPGRASPRSSRRCPPGVCRPLNTVLLLSSGVTVTFAHWNLIENQRNKLLFAPATIALGVAFLVCQGIDNHHAYTSST